MSGWKQYALAVGIVAAVMLAALGLVLWMTSDTRSGAGTEVGYGDTAKLVTVEGVRCIVVNGGGSTAVSCDWESTR